MNNTESEVVGTIIIEDGSMLYKCTGVKDGVSHYKVVITFYDNGRPTNNIQLSRYNRWVYDAGLSKFLKGTKWGSNE